MNDKSMSPEKAMCRICSGKKTLPVTVKGIVTQRPCPSCKGSGHGSYMTK